MVLLLDFAFFRIFRKSELGDAKKIELKDIRKNKNVRRHEGKKELHVGDIMTLKAMRW